MADRQHVAVTVAGHVHHLEGAGRVARDHRGMLVVDAARRAPVDVRRQHAAELGRVRRHQQVEVAVGVHVRDGQQDAGRVGAVVLASILRIAVRAAVQDVEPGLHAGVVPHHHDDQVQPAVAGQVGAVDRRDVAVSAQVQLDTAHPFGGEAARSAVVDGQVAARVVEHHVQPPVAGQVGHAGVALAVGGKHGGALGGEAVGRAVVDHGGGGHRLRLVVVGVGHAQQVQPAVAVEVAHLHVVEELSPAGEERAAVGTQAVRAAVEHAQSVAPRAHQVGMAVLVQVGEDVGVGAPRRQLQPPPRVEAAAGAAGVDVQREVGIVLRRTGHRVVEHDLRPAVAVQVGGRAAHRAPGGQGADPALGESLRAVPEDDRPGLVGAPVLEARGDQVDAPVPVQVGGGQPTAVRQRQRLPHVVERAGRPDLHALASHDQQLVAAVAIDVGTCHPHRTLREQRPVAFDRQDRPVVRGEAPAAVPVDLHLVAAGEDHLPGAVAVQIGQLHLHRVVGRQAQRAIHRESDALPAVDEGVGVVLEPLAVVGHHQLQLAVAVQVRAGDGERGDAGDAEPLAGVLEHARAGLQKDVQGSRLAGVVVVHPRRRDDQVGQSVAGQVGCGEVVGSGGGQIDALAGQAAGAAPVEVGRKLRGDAVLGVDDHQVQVAVAVDVDRPAHPAAVVGELPPAPSLAWSMRLRVDPGRPALVVAVRIGEHQVDVPVAVRVRTMNPLDGPGGGHVEVVAAVVELAFAKGIESAMNPAVGFVSHQRFV